MMSFYKSMKMEKEVFIEFKKEQIFGSLKRLIKVLSLIIGIQLIFIVLEYFNLFIGGKGILSSRLLVIFVCLVFNVLFIVLTKTYKNSLLPIEIALHCFQISAVLLSCYFVAFMFETGIHSFSSFLTAGLVLYIIFLDSPYFLVLVLLASLGGVSIYIDANISSVRVWFGEFTIALVFVIVLIIGSIIKYNRNARLFSQEREIIKINEKLKVLSYFDDMTGIYNRRRIMEILDDYVSLSKRYNTQVCIAMLDIDDFKKVNDDHGHIMGDKVLSQFTGTIMSVLRSTDKFGRWGGEEFLIVFPNCSGSNAYLVVERYRKRIEATNFPISGPITFSVGIAILNEEDNLSKLIGKADSALYKAKELGKNQTVQ